MTRLFKKFFGGLTTNGLLSVLFSEGKYTDVAWEEFLRRFSKLILKVIWKYENDHDKVMDTYLFVCGRISKNNFALLKKYKSDFRQTSPKFSTWLMTVIRNICIDFYRKSHGRRRYPKGIQNLSKGDRLFFELYYWKGLPVNEIAETLGLNNGINEDAISDRLNRINSVLTRTPKAPEIVKTISFDETMYTTRDPVEEPELSASMEAWIENLPVREKIVLRLRFWENLSAREIAEILDIAPYSKVYTILKSSLKKLREKKEQDEIR